MNISVGIKNKKEDTKIKIVGMLKQICGMFRLDRIRNEYTKGKLEITDVAGIIDNQNAESTTIMTKLSKR